MGEFLSWFFGIVILAMGGLAYWTMCIREKYTATIDKHVSELAQARLRLVPPAQFGFVDQRKWNKVKRDFILAHFGLSSRREHAAAQQAWMNKIDTLIDEYLANSTLSDPGLIAVDEDTLASMSAGCGIVYILTNPSMPGLVKIGMTTRDMSARLRELNAATGVPQAFEVIYTIRVSDCAAAERSVHEALREKRTNQGREFFQVSTAEAIDALIAVRQRFSV